MPWKALGDVEVDTADYCIDFFCSNLYCPMASRIVCMVATAGLVVSTVQPCSNQSVCLSRLAFIYL